MLSASKLPVAYGGRLGSAAEVAAVLGEELSKDGAAVTVASVDQVADLSAFDAVVLGSAIRYDRWLPEASAFVEQHRDVQHGRIARQVPGVRPGGCQSLRWCARSVVGVLTASIVVRIFSFVSIVPDADYRELRGDLWMGM